MSKAAAKVYRSSQSYRAIGEIIGGLVALKTLSEDLFVITPSQKMRTPARNISVSDTSILAGGLPIVPFEGTTTWERDSGQACVCFTLSDGSDGIIAPAARPAGMDVAFEVEQFFSRVDEDDDVFLYDIDNSIAPVLGYEGSEVAMKAVSAGGDSFADDDSLVILGHPIRLGDITWVEQEEDGDGNRYLHIVLVEGRYLRICVGDFSR